MEVACAVGIAVDADVLLEVECTCCMAIVRELPGVAGGVLDPDSDELVVAGNCDVPGVA